MQGEEFTQFLSFLSPDPDEAGRSYNRLQEKLVGFFILRGVSDPDGAAAETLDRAAVKIAQGAPVPDIKAYCLGIARNIVKERARKDFRESVAHREFVADLANDSEAQVERIYHLLLPCFDRLSADERALLTAYCAVIRGRERAEHRRKLAERMNTTLLGLRMRVTRLRTGLSDCVKQRTNQV